MTKIQSPSAVLILDDVERLLEFVAIGPRFSNALLQVNAIFKFRFESIIVFYGHVSAKHQPPSFNIPAAGAAGAVQAAAAPRA